MYLLAILALASIAITSGDQGICDQTPPQSHDVPPSLNKGNYELSIVTKGNDSKNIYLPAQTYVLILKTNNQTRPFRWFMISVEDPDADNSTQKNRAMEAGSLKTLESYRQSRYSERCFNTVESADNSDKYQIEIHWLSPKHSNKKQKVRIRATVAENAEAWYTGENLTILLEKDDRKAPDAPPYSPNATCNLCSEARYEVLFKGRWSRMSHPRHYPSKPDDNGYSHMVGASHAFGYTMWQQGSEASKGLKVLAEEANITIIEREIIDAMDETSGTRTLIRGKRRRHPYMSEPSHSLFRVDRNHHLFSLVVAMKPSPDWFLGVTRFELCTEFGWLESSEIPLYPWDAGTMDGISYESPRSVTLPTETVNRVEVGSFNEDSPFYQMNLIDLAPFAYIEVRKLAEYRLEGIDCGGEEESHTKEDNEAPEDSEVYQEVAEEPVIAESKLETGNCVLSEWTEWSECVPDAGSCGVGSQLRTRYQEDKQLYVDGYRAQKDQEVTYGNCEAGQDGTQLQSQHCYVDC